MKIAPLRERREDIPLFIEKFLGDMTTGFQEKKSLSSKALKILTDHSFPGNVRELANILRRAYLHAEGKEIRPEDIILENDDRKDVDVPQRLFHEIVDQGKSFWEVVHKPFLQRELKRSEVMGLLDLGLRKTKGSYRNLLEFFNAGYGDKDYKRFMKVIEVHGLRDKKISPSGGIESPPGGGGRN